MSGLYAALGASKGVPFCLSEFSTSLVPRHEVLIPNIILTRFA
jgi:hypothetical protein